MTLKFAALAATALALMVTGDADAARRDFKIRNTVWTCAGHYVAAPRAVSIDRETGAMTCLSRGERGRRALTRGEASIACREQFNTTSRIVHKTGKGWQCRYYPS